MNISIQFTGDSENMAIDRTSSCRKVVPGNEFLVPFLKMFLLEVDQIGVGKSLSLFQTIY
jgi:hypothetical protein